MIRQQLQKEVAEKGWDFNYEIIFQIMNNQISYFIRFTEVWSKRNPFMIWLIECIVALVFFDQTSSLK